MSRLRVVQWSTGAVGSIAVRTIARAARSRARRRLGPRPGQRSGAMRASSRAGRSSASPPRTTPTRCSRCAPTASVTRPAASRARASASPTSSGCSRRGSTSSRPRSRASSIPPASIRGQVERLEAACRAGGATLYASGIEPGFAGDQLVLRLATLTPRIRAVRTQEIFTYADYPVAFTMFEVFGFGKPPEAAASWSGRASRRSAWGPRCGWSPIGSARSSTGSARPTRSA